MVSDLPSEDPRMLLSKTTQSIYCWSRSGLSDAFLASTDPFWAMTVGGEAGEAYFHSHRSIVLLFIVTVMITRSTSSELGKAILQAGQKET